MTTEEKATKYDEALEWMRKVYPTLTGADKKDAEHYFPEVTKSKNEQIKEALISFLHEMENSGGVASFNGFSIEEYITYLEKQKESLSISESCKEKANSFTDEDEKIRKDVLAFIKREGQHIDRYKWPKWIAWLEKQKENPKSADSISSDCTSDAKCEDQHNEEGDFVFELRQIISSHRYSDIYGEYTNDEEGMASEILELCKCELEKQKEQKPAEWSKEDKKMLIKVEQIVLKHWNSLPDSFYHKYDDEKQDAESCYNWLKSLRPQPKQEWSEKDERMRTKILEALDAYADHVQYTGFCINSELIRNELMGWLKSLNPQPKQEQKPEAKLTGWVARDRDGEICIYKDYPEKDSKGQFWLASGYMPLDQKSFPDLKWEDEPMEVEVTIRKK